MVVEGAVIVILGFSAVVVEAPPNLISVVLERLEEPPKVKVGALVSVIKVLSLSEVVDKEDVLAPNENFGASEPNGFK